jgi:hypothetical protein
MKFTPLAPSIDTPYYIGKLVATLSEGLPCDTE